MLTFFFFLLNIIILWVAKSLYVSLFIFLILWQYLALTNLLVGHNELLCCVSFFSFLNRFVTFERKLKPSINQCHFEFLFTSNRLIGNTAYKKSVNKIYYNFNIDFCSPSVSRSLKHGVAVCWLDRNVNKCCDVYGFCI